jgi:membrane protease subunit (stomatin/prohibitin family)
MKVFPNLKWGTRDPVAFRDSELGLIRLRAFGVYNIRVVQPILFINSLVGTQGVYRTDEIEEYLSRVIVSRFNDLMGEDIDSILNLPSRYNDLSDDLKKRLQEDLSQFGLGLTDLYINAITPPPEVQKAIDDKSRLGLFDDLNKLIKMKAAMAMETAAQNQGEAGAGLGMGMGFMMPAMFADAFKNAAPTPAAPAETTACPDCGQAITREAKFCSHCGRQILVFQQCAQCSAKLAPEAKFCHQCGRPLEVKPALKRCPHCSHDNLNNATFCNDCGERI